MTERERTKEIIKHSRAISWRENSKANEMLLICLNNSDDWEISKLNRWIGYAHCLLVAEGATSIEALQEMVKEIEKD